MLEQIKDFLLSFPPEFWAFLGTAFIMTRFIFITSRQLFLAGLGALTAAILLLYKVINLEDFFFQFVVFFVCTILWSLALWMPFQIRDYWVRKFRYLKGRRCKILGPTLEKNKTSMTQIDGRQFIVKMQPDSPIDTIPKGEEALIVNTKAAILIVEPTSIPRPSEPQLKEYRAHIQDNPLRKI